MPVEADHEARVRVPEALGNSDRGPTLVNQNGCVEVSEGVGPDRSGVFERVTYPVVSHRDGAPVVEYLDEAAWVRKRARSDIYYPAHGAPRLRSADEHAATSHVPVSRLEAAEFRDPHPRMQQDEHQRSAKVDKAVGEKACHGTSPVRGRMPLAWLRGQDEGPLQQYEMLDRSQLDSRSLSARDARRLSNRLSNGISNYR
jgi:hypothetical protein